MSHPEKTESPIATPTVTTADDDAPKRLRSVRAPGFIEVYSNTSTGAFTPWDIEITFGRLDVLEGEQIMSEQVTVLFSPQHAKAVSEVLAGAVKQWEARHGEITLSRAQRPGRDPELTPKAERQKKK